MDLQVPSTNWFSDIYWSIDQKELLEDTNQKSIQGQTLAYLLSFLNIFCYIVILSLDINKICTDLPVSSTSMILPNRTWQVWCTFNVMKKMLNFNI
jgi:hypothetical protein